MKSNNMTLTLCMDRLFWLLHGSCHYHLIIPMPYTLNSLGSSQTQCSACLCSHRQRTKQKSNHLIIATHTRERSLKPYRDEPIQRRITGSVYRLLQLYMRANANESDNGKIWVVAPIATNISRGWTAGDRGTKRWWLVELMRHASGGTKWYDGWLS